VVRRVSPTRQVRQGRLTLHHLDPLDLQLSLRRFDHSPGYCSQIQIQNRSSALIQNLEFEADMGPKLTVIELCLSSDMVVLLLL
jgi:hypothetical protein